MSLVENLINQISTQGLGGITRPLDFDMNDDTFAKLLDKQMNMSNGITTTNTVGQMGAPAGLIIEPVEGIEYTDTALDQMEAVGEKISKEEYINQPIEFKDIDMGDYFSNLLKTNLDEKSDFMNFARKQASNAYGAFRKTYIADMADFVEDLASTL